MDKIEFMLRKRNSKLFVIDIYINGKFLNKILNTSHELLAIEDTYFPTVLLGKHYQSYEEDFRGKLPILMCHGCGIPGCASILARITFKGNKVIWDEMEEWCGADTIKTYKENFVFNKKDYLKELSKVIVKIRTLNKRV